MKELVNKIAITSIFALTSFIANASDLTKAEVIGAMEKSANYHMQHPYPTKISGEAMPPTGIRFWETTPYYDGLIDLSRVTGDAKYWAEVIRLGTTVGWTLNPPYNMRKYHADDHAVGHAWLDTYIADTSRKERIAEVEKSMLSIIADADKQRASGKEPPKKGGHGSKCVGSWTWCDALYMAPPTLARLYKATGNKKFLDYLNDEYKWCYDTLYSPEDDLFYRDAGYIAKTTKSGAKIFWSRGDGWVIGGLVQVLNNLPKDEPSRKFYEDLFVEMITKIASLQPEDGLWTTNLVDTEDVKGGEVSGTGFFVYGLAWGINNGYLDKDKFLPVAQKGWRGLLKCVREDGLVGYVQPIGAAPGSFSKDSTQYYGIGVFLLAGCELSKTLGFDVKTTDSELVKEADEMFVKEDKMAVLHFEPRRVDDLAWENDKMAFRVYGPALKNSIENSGVDVWSKSVSYPVINKWYNEDLAGGKSYHKDNGEGLDAYKVADSIGLGGSAIWKNGKLYKSNVFQLCKLFLTTKDKLCYRVLYFYDIEGTKISEYKTVSLGLGDDSCKVRSVFMKGNPINWYYGDYIVAKPNQVATDIEVATGLFLQTKDAQIVKDADKITVTEKLAKKPFVAFVKSKKPFERFETTGLAKSKEVLGIMKLDKGGAVEYEFGYTWGK